MGIHSTGEVFLARDVLGYTQRKKSLAECARLVRLRMGRKCRDGVSVVVLERVLFSFLSLYSYLPTIQPSNPVLRKDFAIDGKLTRTVTARKAEVKGPL